jgi:nicotinate-nucleotide adenylyltransferase
VKIGILGGTFDPVHQGHVAMALHALNEFQLDKLMVMPCKVPVHKAVANASEHDRIAMLKLAFDHKLIELDLRELERSEASYSVLSLQDYRAQYPAAELYFIIGMDSLNSLHLWYQWEQCLHYANFIVFGRDGINYAPSPLVANFIKPLNHSSLSGNIFVSEFIPPMVASSELRQQLASSTEKPDFLSLAVWNYIQKQRLYQLTSPT